MKTFLEFINEQSKLSLNDINELIDKFKNKYKGKLEKVKSDSEFKKLSKEIQDFILDEMEI